MTLRKSRKNGRFKCIVRSPARGFHRLSGHAMIMRCSAWSVCGRLRLHALFKMSAETEAEAAAQATWCAATEEPLEVYSAPMREPFSTAITL